MLLSLMILTGINLSFQSQQEVEFVDSVLRRSRKKLKGLEGHHYLSLLQSIESQRPSGSNNIISKH